MDNYQYGGYEEPIYDNIKCKVCDRHTQCCCEGRRSSQIDKRHTWHRGVCNITNYDQQVFTPETESIVLKEIRALSDKLSPFNYLKEEISWLWKENSEQKYVLTQANKDLKQLYAAIRNIEVKLKQVDLIEQHMNIIQDRLDRIEKASYAKEQLLKMNYIELKGVPQTSDENLFEVVRKLGTRINFPIKKSYISSITRAPTRAEDGIKPIIVCFCNRYIKDDFIAAARVVAKTTDTKIRNHISDINHFTGTYSTDL